MRIAIIVVIALVASSPLLAQGFQRLTAEERAQRNTEWMKADLELTEDQLVLVEAINLHYAKKGEEIFTTLRESGDFSAMREKMTELGDAKNEEMKAVLSEEQYEKYLKKVEELRAARRRG
jgi:hypothetical protein